MMAISPLTRAYLRELGVLGAGFSLGLVGALAVSVSPADYSKYLAQARKLGLMSEAIAQDYPKAHDMRVLMATLVLPVLGAVIAWTVMRWRSGGGWVPLACVQGEPPVPEQRDRSWRIVAGVAALGMMVLGFNVGSLLHPSWNPFVGAWVFHGEEGENLAWANALVHGAVYAEDFFCLYGPLLIYPLAWALELFEPTALVQRVLRLAWDFGAYALVVLWLYRLSRSRITLGVGAALIFVVFPTFTSPSINFTYLRFGLPLGAMLALHAHWRGGRRVWLAAAGAILGISILFSQEAGFAGLIAVVVGVALRLRDERDLRARLWELGWIGAGALLTMGPMVIYLGAVGSLPRVLEILVGYPRLMLLGYGGKAAPPLANFLASPLAGEPLYYGTALFYGVAAVHLGLRLVRGRLRPDDLVLAMLCAYGAVALTVPCKRFALESVHKVLLPAVLLWVALIDRGVASARQALGPPRVGGMILALGLLGPGLLAGVSSPFVGDLSPQLALRAAVDSKLTPRPQGVTVPEVPRLGPVRVDPRTALRLRQMKGFLDQNTKPGESVAFFPNEAAYYFLFDRPSPTRYVVANFAATRGMRVEYVRELEASDARYVLYTHDSWRIDGIPEAQQLPEIVQYLRERWRPVAHLSGVTVLERRGGEG